MCGIAGVLRPGAREGELASDLDRMWPGIAARGPDGRGQLVVGGVALLNARLAVIDPHGGDQPIWNEDGSVGCVFNGEIYNHADLRRELQQQGHKFGSSTDTEVLVHLYEEEGARIVDRLRGMYAFALYDARRSLLLVARDRLGIKPLYLAPFRGGWAFASSIASLLELGVSGEADFASLVEYLQFYKVPEPQTCYRDISTLLPGHFLLFDAAHGEAKTEKFFDPGGLGSIGGEPYPDDEAARARSAFGDAVRSHLVADVEVGAFLSGGIDSSLVVAEAQRAAERPLRTFTVSFAGHDGFDEAPQAELVAKRLGTDHETLPVHVPPLELLHSALDATTQPFAVTSFLPLMRVSQLASSRGVKVVLSGDGGDEVGLGYAWYRWMARVGSLPRSRHASRVAPWLRSLEIRSGPLGPAVRRSSKFLRGAVLGGAAGSDAWRYDLTQGEALKLLVPEAQEEAARRGLRLSPTALAWSEELPPAQALQRADLAVLLRDEMLTKLDRASMAYGLEARVPLLDDDFVDAMAVVPTSVHLAHSRGKALLRAWAAEAIPGIDFDRPKRGFNVPMNDWLTGALRPEVERLLLTRTSKGLIDPCRAQLVWNRTIVGVPGAAQTLYAMLLAELWWERAR